MMKKCTLWVAALVLLLALVLASCGGGQGGGSGQGGGGQGGGGGGGSQTTAAKKATTETTTVHKKVPIGVTKSYSNLSRDHTKEPVDYPQTPPVGGPHNPIWQNCGFYSKPLRNEYAVHSMEHGAVWITYSPDLPKDQVETLRDIAHRNSYVLVSPYSDLPSQVVASAWGKQLHLNSADDPRLEQFVRAYQQGPQNPEPGAPCNGGVGSPE
jgi:predicted small secreted protein